MQPINEQIDKMNFIKIKNFCSLMDIIKKGDPKNGRIFANIFNVKIMKNI